jgi:hypothetical protein
VITLGEPHPPQQLSNDINVIDVSADGRWIVYDSPVSGSQIEIFMRPFPDVTASRTKISVDGGRYPRFSPKDDEIYYVDPDGEMMAVAIKLSPTVEVGSAKRLFTYRKPDTGSWDYDLSPVDGRFLIVQRPGAERQERIETVSVVLNWSSELTRLAPKKP